MTNGVFRTRRAIATVILILSAAISIIVSDEMWQPTAPPPAKVAVDTGQALDTLQTISIKGRAAKTGYERTNFGNGWDIVDGCDMRNIILKRDLKDIIVDDSCKVLNGTLHDPYTGKTIEFKRGPETSDEVQIDHVVALSDAWQKGAQQLTPREREQLANDPLELLAVDGKANQEKGDGDAATWLPSNKVFRCQYVARQIAVKSKYELWVTQAEHDAMKGVLALCPNQSLPTI